MRDIEVTDLHEVLTSFYASLDRDPLVGPYFATVDMRAHLPRIVAFWSTLIFGTRSYSGNAFRPHERLSGLEVEHFERWLATFERTIDTRFAGPAARAMKSTAHRIAYSMQLRLGIAPLQGAWERGDRSKDG